jgi:citrate lyase subunit beta/citryl-CoA lyase
MLYVPGNKPSLIRDIAIYKPDSIMIDLEDSIAFTEKDSARLLTYHALKQLDFKSLGIETVVRINGIETDFGELDLEAIVRAQPDIIRLPKTETKNDVLEVEAIVKRIEIESGIAEGTTKLMAAIESPLGVLNALEIATSSKRIVGIALGAEDYVTNMKTKRSKEGTELMFARGQILNAARAAGISALDTVYSDVENLEGFIYEAKMIHQLGFDGKSLIHPSQVDAVHEIFTPSELEISKSIRIVTAAREAIANGEGVITVGGKMVDGPIITRAEYILKLAKKVGKDIGGVLLDE